MEYQRIISVSGLGGLYELVGSKSDGAIVRSLADKSTKFVSSRVHQFSHLESIEVFGQEDNVNLVEVFSAMKESSEKLPDEKDAAATRKYFEKVFPAMDFDRVYGSDMKKMLKWFSVLDANGVKFELPEEEQEPEEEEESAPVEEKPAAQKKKAAKEESTPEKSEPKKAPAKKAAAPASKKAAK